METFLSILWILVVAIQNFHGLAMPFFIDFINRNVYNEKARFWISILSCLIIASALNINELLQIKDLTDATFFVGKVSFIFAQAQIVYKQWWEKSKTRQEFLNKQG